MIKLSVPWGWFKKKTVSVDQVAIDAERQMYIEAGRNVEFFPYSLEEFERMKGCKYMIIEVQGSEKTICYYNRKHYQEQLGRCGVEALIHFERPKGFRSALQLAMDDISGYQGYGIPVKRAT